MAYYWDLGFTFTSSSSTFDLLHRYRFWPFHILFQAPLMSRPFLVHVPTSIKSTNWNKVNMHNKSEGMQNIILLFQVYIRVEMYHSLLDANFTSSSNSMCLLLTCLNFCNTWSPFNLHLLCQNFSQLILWASMQFQG